MKCYVHILHALYGGIPPEHLEDKDWPPDAVTTVAGTAVCWEHVSHIANHQVFSSEGITALPQRGG